MPNKLTVLNTLLKPNVGESLTLLVLGDCHRVRHYLIGLRWSLFIRSLSLGKHRLRLGSMCVHLLRIRRGLFLRLICGGLNNQLVLQLLVLQKHLIHVALVPGPRRLFNRDIASVRTQQCVGLLALLDVLILQKES